MKGKRDGKQDDGKLRKCWVFLLESQGLCLSFRKQFKQLQRIHPRSYVQNHPCHSLSPQSALFFFKAIITMGHANIYSQFSFFEEIIVHKVTANTELVNSDPTAPKGKYVYIILHYDIYILWTECLRPAPDFIHSAPNFRASLVAQW